MGVYSRKYKKGVTWYIRYNHNGEQIVEKVGRTIDGFTKKQAENALTSRRGDIVQGRFNVAQTRQYPRFNKLMAEYLEYSKMHKKAFRRDTVSAKHLLPFFGKKRTDEITTFMIEQYKKKRQDKIKAMPKNIGKADRDISFCSINRELSMLKHFFTMAIKWGKAEKNPVRGVKMFPEKMRERYLTEGEIPMLLDACRRSKNKHLYVIVLFALNTGARLQEVLQLRAKDLDFNNSIIYLEHTKNGDRGKVPMNEYLRAALKAHLAGHEHEYLFCDNSGRPFANIRKAFINALKEAGIKDFHFHDLRHTFASQLAMNGVEGTTLQALGRWKTPSMVMRYAHLSESHKKKAVNTLNGLFGGKVKITRTLTAIKH